MVTELHVYSISNFNTFNDLHSVTRFFSDLSVIFTLVMSNSDNSGQCLPRNTCVKKKIFNIRSRGYKTFSMLNSAEHEILNAHKYKNI